MFKPFKFKSISKTAKVAFASFDSFVCSKFIYYDPLA